MAQRNQMRNIHKILVTGGHISPALAFIDYLKIHKPNCDIVFVGRKYSSESNISISFEYTEIYKRGIKFYNLIAGRLTRLASLHSIINLLRFPVGFVQSILILIKEHPDAIISFGGYLALPISICAYLFRIPVYTHEQTIYPGLTNIIIGKFAKRVFLSFWKTNSFFDKAKTIYSGNLIRECIFKTKSNSIHIDKTLPCIYITGGSLGSHSLNKIIGDIVLLLLDKYTVIHQTGNVLGTNDSIKFKTIQNNLPKDIKNRYIVREHFFENEIGYVYNCADLIVGRSGANTCFEIAALKKPAIFVPLPWSANNEQMGHAKLLQSFGACEIFEQSEESLRLYHLINKMIDNKEKYESAYRKFPFANKHDAALRIIDEIYK